MLKTYLVDGRTFDLGDYKNLDIERIKEIIRLGMRGNPKIINIKYKGRSSSWYDTEKEKDENADPRVLVIAFDIETKREYPDDTIPYRLLCFDNHNETRMNILLADALTAEEFYYLGHHGYI